MSIKMSASIKRPGEDTITVILHDHGGFTVVTGDKVVWLFPKKQKFAVFMLVIGLLREFLIGLIDELPTYERKAYYESIDKRKAEEE